MTAITAPRIPLSQSLAIEQFKGSWTDQSLADIATALTCDEFEALLDLLHSFDLVSAETAAKIEDVHAAGDEHGDMHCRCKEPWCIEEREG